MLHVVVVWVLPLPLGDPQRETELVPVGPQRGLYGPEVHGVRSQVALAPDALHGGAAVQQAADVGDVPWK